MSEFEQFCQQVKVVFGKDCKMTYKEINGEIKRTKDDWIEVVNDDYQQ